MHIPHQSRTIFISRLDHVSISSDSLADIKGSKKGSDSYPEIIESQEFSRTSSGDFAWFTIPVLRTEVRGVPSPITEGPIRVGVLSVALAC
jgi:hypothetical protein